MSIPAADVSVPDRVRALATGAAVTPGWEDTLIEAYDIAPDRERLAHYRRLWNES